ncbi:hypothetical protein OAA09_01000 [bacterium]|nr:hypothetical protein [bacterium]
MKEGDQITFSGCYTVYNPRLDKTKIEMNVILRVGIITKIEKESIEVFSNDEFCNLLKDDPSCTILCISSL